MRQHADDASVAVWDLFAEYQGLAEADRPTTDQQRIDQWLSLFRDTEVTVNDPTVAGACTRLSADTIGATDAAVTAASPTVTSTAFTRPARPHRPHVCPTRCSSIRACSMLPWYRLATRARTR